MGGLYDGDVESIGGDPIRSVRSGCICGNVFSGLIVDVFTLCVLEVGLRDLERTNVQRTDHQVTTKHSPCLYRPPTNMEASSNQ